MFWVYLGFVAFPLLGYQFFGWIGALIGLVLAYVVLRMDRFNKKSKEDQEKTFEKINEGLNSYASKMQSMAERINADTERRKQKRLEKKLAKKQKEMAGTSE